MDKRLIVHDDVNRHKATIEGVKESNLTERNKQLILEYVIWLRREGIGIKRVLKYIYHLKYVGLWLEKDFDKVEKEDIMLVVDKIDSHGYSVHTVYDYKTVMRRFYKWLYKVDRDPFGLKTPTIKQRTKLPGPEEIFNEDEIKLMVGAARSIRNAAIIITLYETGARASEFLTLQVKDVEFDDNGAKIRLVGKTGERYVRAVSCVPYLSNWLANIPKDPEDFVWICDNRNSKKRLEYNSLRKIVRETMQRAGVHKRGNPHSFRKSRATHLANFLTESNLCQFMGWTLGSREAVTYVRTSMKGTEDAILGMYGMVNNNKGPTVLQLSKCPICGWFNKEAVSFCSRCGKPLTVQSALERDTRRQKADEIMNLAVKYPEFMEVLEKILRKEIG